MGAIYVDGICYSSGGGGGGASSADQVSLDDTNLAYEADDVQEAFEKVTKSLTYTEYEALTEEEKNNGTLYFITDVNGDGQSFQPVIYSTEEREVGVWTDGKPIYQKTLTCTTTTAIGPDAWATMPWDEEPENIDTLITGQNHQGNVPNSYATPRVEYTGGHLKMAALYSSTFGEGKKFTVWYTKTTDTAGSGKWTPQGVPAVHYSTDEQVVGTWIDGKTLYEKTVVSTSALNQGTTNQIDLGTTNVKDFVSVEGFASYGSNNSYVPLPYGDRANSNICITTITKSGTANIYIGPDYASPSTINLVIITVRYTKSST